MLISIVSEHITYKYIYYFFYVVLLLIFLYGFVVFIFRRQAFLLLSFVVLFCHST